MRKPGLPRDYKVYIVLTVLFIALVFLMPRSERFNNDYKKGSPWMYETLVAKFDFPILKTEAQIQQERESAGSGVIPYYKFSDDALTKFIKSLETIDLDKWDYLVPNIRDIITRIYSKGVLADFDNAFSDDRISVIYIQKDKRASKHPLSDVYSISDAQYELMAELTKLELTCDEDSLCRDGGLYELFTPNLLFDKEITDLVHDEAVDYISPTSGVVKAGQLIVSNGEIVTAEIQQLLDSYKAQYNSLGYQGSLIFMWFGNILIALILVYMLFLTVYFANPQIYTEFNKFVYLVVIYFLTVLITLLIGRMQDPKFIYLVPFSLMAMFMVAFFKKRVVLPVYTVSLLPLLIFVHGGTELFVMYLVAGAVAIFSFMKFNRGWQQFLTAFFVFISLCFTFVMFRLVEDSRSIDGTTIFYLGLGSLFSVAGYPLVYLWERIFMLVSTSRLQELSDTNNNKLLRELAHKAPGTFQHSLQVMNMADAVARAIEVNVELVRCGALYHDIGKISNPLCYIENETSGDSYHKNISTIESAKAIINHVSAGLALAEKANLPDVIKSFITTLHGTTCTAYFYNKYLHEGGDPNEASSFYYSGPKPTTKEQSILMLCDSIEAASRTLKDFSTESISEFVENICNGKINQGQFEEADISMKELFIVKAELKEYLKQAHHARVDYPNS